ncbi:MAG: DUF262 domain-containing protein [Ignavibacteriales bacterium]|nr:DUF262 domain-containing protein [Ignavibacteriales bacterium]
MNIFNEELNIESLIKYAENEKIWLPEFQRPFVWDKNQIRLIIDSLYHNYTISSILLWEGGDELARRRVGASIKEIKIPEGKNENIVYLLDGQQRTTALLLAFSNKSVYRGRSTKKKEVYNIYWDSEYKDSDPELRWIFDDDKIYLNGDEEPIMLKNYTQQELFKNFKTRYVSIKHAFNFKEDEASLVKEMGEEKAFSFLYNYQKQVTHLRENILLRQVKEIEQKGSLEQVLEVFERINTKNTKLSIFDIMVAKTYRKFEEGFFDLRTYYKIINYRDSVKPDFFENLDNLDLDKVELILDESDLLNLTMIILRQKFKATEILKLDTSLLMNNTKYLHDKFIFLVGFMNQNFNIEPEELGKYQPMMKFLAAAISEFKDVNIKENEFLNKWFWNTLLKNRYPGAQNERIAKDYERISKNKSLEDALVKMLKDNTRSFTQIEKSTPENPEYYDAHYSSRGQQIYRALFLLLKSKGAKDFYSGLNPAKSGASAYLLEEHHIFPTNSLIGKAISKKYSDKTNSDIINNIANIALITKETNNKRISARLPSDYIVQFENDYQKIAKHDQFLEIMDSQFISPEMIESLKNDDFEKFIFQRTKLISEQIKLLCE